MTGGQLKPEMNLYQQQIQQMRHHQHNLGGHALSQPHLINHNLTNHLTNHQHLINHNLGNHQFANHAQLDDFLSSGVAAVAAAAVANLSQQTGPQHSLPLPATAASPDKPLPGDPHEHLERNEHDPSSNPLTVTQLYTPHYPAMNGKQIFY